MRRDRLVSLTASLALAAAAAVVWEVAARRSDSFLLPTASETVLALLRLASSGELWRAVWTSNTSLLLGLPLALLTGIPLGLAVGRYPMLDRWIGVHLNVLIVTPKSALMPIIVMAFGFGLLTRAAIVAVFAFPVIVITLKAGVTALDPRLDEMARAFGASERQIWRLVLLPAARPALATAFRLGLARAVSGMISVELLLVAVGLGGLILNFQADFDAAAMYAVTLMVMAEAVALVALAAQLGRWLGESRSARVLE